MPSHQTSARILSSRQVRVEIEIRECTAADLPRLEWFGMFTTHREIIDAAWKQHQRGRNLMLVADCRGFPVGQVWIDLSHGDRDGVGLIWAVRVMPCWQGLGIGRMLMLAAEDALGCRGFRIAELGVEQGNSATEFYRSLGYRKVGTLFEEHSYTTADGVDLRVPVDQTLWQKDLSAAETDADPASAAVAPVSRAG